MKVAVPVAIATGRKVLTLISGSISSMANITPPIGVLKVAAMPAPAPAATRMMRWPIGMRITWPKRRAERRADLDDRSFAADRRAAADRQRRGQRLHHRDDRPDHAALVVDRVHHLGHAVALRLGREIADDEGDADRADHRHQDDPRSPRGRRGEHVGVVVERPMAEEQQVVDEADQLAKDHRAEAGDDADDQREQAKRYQQ